MVVNTENAVQSLLIVASAKSNQDALLQAKASAQDQANQVMFEAFERVAEAPLDKSSYNKLVSNAIAPSVLVHSPQVLSRYLSTLTANGTLELLEPVLLTPMSDSMCPISRKDSDVVSLLKLTGFVDVVVSRVVPLSDQDLVQFIQTWGAVRVDQGVERLSGKLGVAYITARKPAYEIGQKVKLNLRNKKAAKKAAWTVSTNDDDLEDDEALLDEEDKVKPSKESLARPDDCELTNGKRKACKNCTCGRADMMDEDESPENVVSLDLLEDPDVVEVDPTPKAVGGCGSCALGDAFRCSTCPYLGMPAFNPGEKVTLGGMFGKDDIDI